MRNMYMLIETKKIFIQNDQEISQKLPVVNSYYVAMCSVFILLLKSDRT